MRIKRFPFILRSPEGEGTGGGGDGAAPDAMSYDRAAEALFSDAGSTDSSGAGDVGEKPAVTKPAATDKKPSAKPDAQPERKGIFDKIGKKDAAAAAPDAEGETKPDAAAPDAADLPEDRLNLDEKAKPETAKQFSELKKIAKEVRGQLTAKDTEIQTLRQQLAARNIEVGDPAELARIREEHKAFSERLSIVDLQSHPEFKKSYGEPIAKLTGSIKETLEANEIAGVNIDGILAKSGPEFRKAVNEIAEKLGIVDQQAFVADMRELQKVQAASKEALGKSGEVAQQLQKRAADQQRAAFEETWTKLGGMDNFLVKLDADADMSPEERTEIESYNAAVSGVKAEAEKIAFGVNDDKGIAQVAHEAATLRFLVKKAIPRMEREFAEKRELVKKLTAEIEGLRGHRPKPTAPAGGDAGGGGDDAGTVDAEAEARKVWRQ